MGLTDFFKRKTEKNVAEPTAKKRVSAEQYGCIDDASYIGDFRHIDASPWQQYDVLFDARPYGWEMMRDWADYMASADLDNISQVTAGTLGSDERNITEAYLASGGSCKATSLLDTEMGMLSVAGLSRTLGAPTKIVWVNQTRTLRLFTLVADEELVKRYVETMVRRTFGTEDAMKAAVLKKHSNFKLVVKDVFFVDGRGVVLDGVVEGDSIKRYDNIVIGTKNHKVVGISVGKDLVEQADIGKNVGLLIDSQDISAFKAGDIVTKANA